MPISRLKIFRLNIAILLLMLIPVEAASRDGLAIWESRCEECHGDPAVFSSKYLWDIDGQLQGRHHIDNLKLFMGNHYIPDHEIDTIRIMLRSRANSAVRFKTECSGCHGDVKEFIEKSLWVRRGGITAMESGIDLIDFLPTHQGLQLEDVTFYRKLFARIAVKPIP
jgi:hypothetical protein